MGKMVYLTDVATLQLDQQTCIGCGMCLTVCPHQVFELSGKKARIASKDACMECGACANNCPVAAISVESGVGCAQAVLNTMLGRVGGKPSSPCC